MKVGDKVRVYRKVRNIPGCSLHQVGFEGVILADVTLRNETVQVFLVEDTQYKEREIKEREIVPKTALAYAKD